MRYVIFHTDTTLILYRRKRNGCTVEYYASEGAAKAALTRLDKAGKLHDGATKEDYAIEEVSVFRSSIEKKVERRNLLSGKTYMEAVNTPNYCSPSSEAYWSM